MELIVRHFSDLTVCELLDLLKLRVSVFVVEQKCPYQEIDDFDTDALHLWLAEEGAILAYARVLPPGTAFATPSIGRVLTVKRRQGLGLRIVRAAICAAKERWPAEEITICAQVYAKSLYEKLGFVPSSDVFSEDGIPHLQMTLSP